MQDKVLFPIQIIVTGELDRKGHTWLKALSDRMEKQDVRCIAMRKLVAVFLCSF